MKKILVILIIFLIMLLLIAFQSHSLSQERTFRFKKNHRESRILPPFDWPISNPQDQGLDPNIFKSVNKVAKTLPYIYSFLVVKNGFLISERYFNSKNKKEATLKIIPIHLGVRLRLSEQKIVPFLGASISLNFFRENVPLQTVLDTKLGFLVETGIFIRISKRYFIKFDFNYNYCQIKPFHTRINIGGINAGFGLKYCF